MVNFKVTLPILILFRILNSKLQASVRLNFHKLYTRIKLADYFICLTSPWHIKFLVFPSTFIEKISFCIQKYKILIKIKYYQKFCVYFKLLLYIFIIRLHVLMMVSVLLSISIFFLKNIYVQFYISTTNELLCIYIFNVNVHNIIVAELRFTSFAVPQAVRGIPVAHVPYRASPLKQSVAFGVHWNRIMI